MVKPLTIIALVIPVVLAKYLYDRLTVFGAFRKEFNKINVYVAEGDYFTFPGIVHAEDLALHQPSGLIVALGQTEGLRRSGYFPGWSNFDRPDDGDNSRGALWIIDPETWKETRIHLVGFEDKSFVTHGFDIFPSDDPTKFHLHAINHHPVVENGVPQPVSDSVVEHFLVDLSRKVAEHIRTFRHPLIYTPNDIFSLGPDEFLVTNDHFNREHGIKRLMEDFLTFSIVSWTNIVHVNGSIADVVATRLHNANGLGHGPNNEVIQADAAGPAFNTYTWSNSQLKHKASWPVGLAIDNPSYYDDPYKTPTSDASGYVLAGLLTGIQLDHQSRDPNANIPSAVHIVRKSLNNIEKKLLLEDDGTFMSSAATAILIPIKPEQGSGKKEVWAVIDGPWARAVSVAKVDLTDWARQN